MNKYDEIITEIGKIKSKTTLTMQDIQTLAFCYGALQALNLPSSNIPETNQSEELIDIFPALKEYQYNHNEHNFKKLCLEIREFCQSIYSMTINDEQRKIYFDMVKSLTTV
jgi:hypothetical protein